MTATGDYQHLRDLSITGSKTQKDNQVLQLELNKINDAFTPVLAGINAAKKEFESAKKNNRPEKELDSLSEKVTAASKLREPLAEKYEAVIHQFVVTHPNSVISPFQMRVYIGSWPLADIKKIYANFSDAVKSSADGKAVLSKIKAREKSLSETTAKNFTAVDVNGKTINLTDFKGHYVLLDFWGSWCIPCREGMPHMIADYKKYNEAGLDIIAIAIQEPSLEDWKKAIVKDKTNIWTNIRGDITTNKINTSYSINVYPTKFSLISKV